MKSARLMLILVILLIALTVPGATYVSAATLNHGVDCTASTYLLGSNLRSDGNQYESFLHRIKCNRVVEQIIVQGYGYKEGFQNATYTSGTETCTNVSECYLVFEIKAPPPSYQCVRGWWITKTNGWVGTPSNKGYYGFVPDVKSRLLDEYPGGC